MIGSEKAAMNLVRIYIYMIGGDEVVMYIERV